jgi:hypothetical protein
MIEWRRFRWSRKALRGAAQDALLYVLGLDHWVRIGEEERDSCRLVTGCREPIHREKDTNQLEGENGVGENKGGED